MPIRVSAFLHGQKGIRRSKYGSPVDCRSPTAGRRRLLTMRPAHRQRIPGGSPNAPIPLWVSEFLHRMYRLCRRGGYQPPGGTMLSLRPTFMRIRTRIPRGRILSAPTVGVASYQPTAIYASKNRNPATKFFGGRDHITGSCGRAGCSAHG